MRIVLLIGMPRLYSLPDSEFNLTITFHLAVIFITQIFKIVPLNGAYLIDFLKFF